jgi:predicted AlkP superfamily pyrophosphatase or phosphodiesterase
MPQSVVLLSIPGLRSRDLGAMPRLLDLTRKGLSVPLQPSSPAISSSVQANLTTGVGPERHGVISDGFYWRDRELVEKGNAWNDVIQAPQLWETLKSRDASLTSALWFAQLSKGAKADVICTPDPVHNPDGSASLLCYSKPAELYPSLRDGLGDFPLNEFRGPQASLKSTAWIVDSFVQTAYLVRPRFSHVSLPHLGRAAMSSGPDSPEAQNAVVELDLAIGALVDGFAAAGLKGVAWLVASEYCITPVSRYSDPNRVLQEAGLQTPVRKDGPDSSNFRDARAFALVAHQLAHVYVRDTAEIARVADLFRGEPTVSRVLVGEERGDVGLNHPRSGEVVLLAQSDAWFADVDPASDPALAKGSHGSLESEAAREGVLVSSDAADWFAGKDSGLRDVDIHRLVLSLFRLS